MDSSSILPSMMEGFLANMETTQEPPLSTETPVVHEHPFIGSGLAIGGNLLISISLNLQKYAHNKNEADPNPKHYTKQPIWWVGIILMALGELGNFSAYGFAPASLVAPLGTTTVVANMFIAVIFLKEKLRPEDLFGCTLAVIGAFLLVNFSQKDEAILDAQAIVSNLTETAFIVYIAIEISAIVGLMIAKYKFKVNSVLVLLLITSLISSFTVISAKAVSGMIQLTFTGEMQLDTVIFWMMTLVMAVTCIVQVKYLNQAMMAYDSTVVVPTNFVFFTISAIVAGIVFYKEFWGMKPLNIVMFLFGCLLCFFGVYFITVGRSANATDDGQKSFRERFLDVICPTWLFTKVNGDYESTDGKSDRVPIISDDPASPLSSKDGQSNLAFQDGDTSNGKLYGATQPP